MLIPGMAADVNVSIEPKKVTYGVPTKLSVGTTASEVLATNANRMFAVFINTDTSKTISISIGGTPIFGEAIPLAPRGGAYQMTLTEGNLDTAAVEAITNTGTATLIVIEGEAAI